MNGSQKKQPYYGLTRAEAEEKISQEKFKRVTVSLYKYVHISHHHKMRDELFATWKSLDCLGRIYISPEGINAQMSVPEHNWDIFKSDLYRIPELINIPLKIGVHHDTSFYKLQVKIRNQIVADGLTMDDYNIENVGNHLSAEEFNSAMGHPNAVVVDMRNHYESEIGHFDGAITPQVDTFREELSFVAKELEKNKDKKLLLYCTGGIRCEKASAYLKDKGFTDVNQLHGGIIDYKHQVDRMGLENKFLGSNYVFDERNPEKIGNKVISSCDQCLNTCDRHVNCANHACNILFLQCDSCNQNMQETCSPSCKKIINLNPKKLEIYYKKNMRNKKSFSKSLRNRKRFYKVSPLQKIINIFSK